MAAAILPAAYAQWVWALSALTVQLLAGYADSWSPLARLRLPADDPEGFWLVPLSALGIGLGGLAHGVLLNCSRRVTLIAAPTLAFLTVLLPQPQLSLLCPVLWGMSSGIALATTSIFLAENCTADLRGPMCGTALAFGCLGRLYAHALGFAELSLRTLAALPLPAEFLAVAMLLLSKDTPYHHAFHLNPAHMILSLAHLRGDDQLAAPIREEALDIKERVDAEREAQSDPRASRRAAALVVFLVGTLPLTGHWTATASWCDAGPDAAFKAAVEFCAALVCGVLLDRVGRRALLIGGSLLAAVAMATFSVHHIFNVAEMPWLRLSILVFHGAASYLGPVMVPFVILGEVLPLASKALVPAVAVCLYAVLLSVTNYAATIMPIWALSYGFCFWNVVVMCVAIYLPETKGAPLHSSGLSRSFLR